MPEKSCFPLSFSIYVRVGDMNGEARYQLSTRRHHSHYVPNQESRDSERNRAAIRSSEMLNSLLISSRKLLDTSAAILNR